MSMVARHIAKAVLDFCVQGLLFPSLSPSLTHIHIHTHPHKFQLADSPFDHHNSTEAELTSVIVMH